MPAHLGEEPPQARVIAGDGEIVEMPFEHLRYPRPGFLDGIMHPSTQLHLDVPKFCPHALLDRLAPDNETSGLPRLGAKVRKAEENVVQHISSVGQSRCATEIGSLWCCRSAGSAAVEGRWLI